MARHRVVPVAYGLMKGRAWAWKGAIILAILWIIVSLAEAALGTAGAGIIDLIINVLIIYYLTRPHVKTFFGK